MTSKHRVMVMKYVEVTGDVNEEDAKSVAIDRLRASMEEDIDGTLNSFTVVVLNRKPLLTKGF
jgi:hypothetical protein